MATIQPTSGTSAPASGGGPAAAAGVAPVEATVASVPDKIAQLTRQIQVSGTVAQLPDANGVVLNTVIGNLTIILPQLADAQKQKLVQQLIALFQSQKPLTVVIQPGNPPAQVFLLMPQQLTSPAMLPTDTIALTQSTGGKPGTLLVTGMTLSAVVLAPNNALSPPVQNQPQTGATPLAVTPQAQEPLPQTSPILVQGSRLPLETLAKVAEQVVQTAAAQLPGILLASEMKQESALLRAAGQTPLPALPSLSTPSSMPSLPNAAPAMINPPSTLPPVLSALLQPGRDIVIRVDEIMSPAATVPMATNPNQIVATVAGNGPGGQLILTTDNATIYVRQSATAPVGANLLITVEGADKTASPALLPMSNAQIFSSLQQVLAALMQADPQIANKVLASAIPQPNAALGGALLFFLSAIKQGDVRGWLGGPAADALARIGKFDLLARLAQDMSQPTALVRDQNVGEWRAFPVPLHTNGQLQILNLYVHRDPHHGGGETARRGAAQVRFLIDMRMSKLGPMQLDGLVQPKKLDMIVRSEAALPAPLPQELRDSYLNTLSALGYAGALHFQIGRQNWLVIQNEAPQSVMT